MPPLRFVDRATLAYLAGVSALILAARGRASDAWPAWLAAHLGTAATVAWLAARPRAGVLGWIRELYPLPLFVLLYRGSEALNHAVFARPLDPWFLRAESTLFGTVPALAFAERAPSPWIAETLYAAYFSFYVMIAGMGVYLVATDRPAARRFMGTLAAVFYACYAAFIVLPVVGPRLLDAGGSLGFDGWRPMPAGTQSGPFARLMSVLYDLFEGQGGAFPSSHVLVACLTLRESFRRGLAIRWVHAGAVVLLCAGTVYGRYHYVLDVVAGLVLAPLLIRAAERLQDRFDGPAAADGRTDAGADQSARS